MTKPNTPRKAGRKSGSQGIAKEPALRGRTGKSAKSATASPMVPRRKSRRSAIAPNEIDRPDRRREILLQAERLFAQDGYHAVSIRDIASAARVPIALVGYYFGPKEELFTTIFEHRKSYIVDRLTLMRGVDPASPELVEKLIRAWVGPTLNLRASESGEAFSLLLARAVWDQGEECRKVIERYYDPLATAFIDAMSNAMPECDRGALIWAYQYSVAALLAHIADNRVERLSLGKETPGDLARGEDLIAFIVAGFEALRARSAT